MPTLDWIGKKAVVNHHNEVPFHLLKEAADLSVGDADAGNLLVEGDNLLALKALLPYYAGQVKCIYIDPPYNTGNEEWIYNDNVNSPEIRRWLGKVVRGEMEDLSRHDKWLCMMYPRLVLLRDLLRLDGIIMVSIDDFEAHRLRGILDEIFGPANFIAQLVWDKTRKNDAKLFSVGHEYILVYARSLQTLRDLKTVWREQKPGANEIISEWRRLQKKRGNGLSSIEKDLREWYKALPTGHPAKKLSRYKWVDEWGPWRDRDISWPGGGGPRYDVLHPVTKKPCKVPERGWGFASSDEMQRQVKAGLVVFRDDHTQPPFRKAHLLPPPEEMSTAEDDDGDDEVESDDEELAGLQVMPSVMFKQAQVAVKLQRKIFAGKKVFPNPKDHEVIMRLLRYTTEPGDIILDAFAGSGTTGHAVLQMNAEDLGKRRFVLVEMNSEIISDVTRVRLERVSKGVEGLPPLGGGFRYCKLGPAVFGADAKINPTVTFPELARHVFFTETGRPLPKQAKADTPMIGLHQDKAVYLLYNGILKDKRPAGGNVLTQSVLSDLPKHGGPKVVYGTSCRFSSARLKREKITFKQIPYEIRIR